MLTQRNCENEKHKKRKGKQSVTQIKNVIASNQCLMMRDTVGVVGSHWSDVMS